MPSGRCLALVLMLLSGATVSARGDDPPPPPPAALKPPAFDEFVVIPLRVHILRSSDLPDVDCGLTDADIRRVLGKVNGIWHQAGVHWGLESLVRETAARQDRFKKALEDDPEDRLDVFRLLIPEESRLADGIDVLLYSSIFRQWRLPGQPGRLYPGNSAAPASSGRDRGAVAKESPRTNLATLWGCLTARRRPTCWPPAPPAPF